LVVRVQTVTICHQDDLLKGTPMKPIAKRAAVLLASLLASWFVAQPSASAEPAALPVKVSPNKRYFVDQNDNPVFWLGTTQWQLFRGYTLEDAKTILEKSAGHGFAFVQVMLMGVGDGTVPNVYGQKGWIDNNPLTPNDAYFTNVDAVVRAAADNNLVISMTLFHQRYRKWITLENARAWAKWLAGRYKDAPNIVWSMTPEAKQEFVPILRELAAGLREGDGGRHLVTFKPDPAPYLMAEGAYEAGSEYGFPVTPLWVRRQAYYSYLAGAHHTYGHNDSWRILPTWKEALDAPGAVQMGILKRIFLARNEWWLLVPDQSVLASGGQTEGKVLHLAARHQDGKWVMVYLGDMTSFSVNMNKLSAARVRACWIDPRTGDSAPIGVFGNTGVKPFATPAGWEDALLVLEAAAE